MNIDMLRLLNQIANRANSRGYIGPRALYDIDAPPLLKECLRNFSNYSMHRDRKQNARIVRLIRKLKHQPDPHGTIIDWTTLNVYREPLDARDYHRQFYHDRYNEFRYIVCIRSWDRVYRVLHRKRDLWGDLSTYRYNSLYKLVERFVYINEHTVPKLVRGYIHLDEPTYVAKFITTNTKYICLRAEPLEPNLYDTWLFHKEQIHRRYVYTDNSILGIGKTISAAKSSFTHKLKHTIDKELHNETV